MICPYYYYQTIHLGPHYAARKESSHPVRFSILYRNTCNRMYDAFFNLFLHISEIYILIQRALIFVCVCVCVCVCVLQVLCIIDKSPVNTA